MCKWKIACLINQLVSGEDLKVIHVVFRCSACCMWLSVITGGGTVLLKSGIFVFALQFEVSILLLSLLSHLCDTWFGNISLCPLAADEQFHPINQLQQQPEAHVTIPSELHMLANVRWFFCLKRTQQTHCTVPSDGRFYVNNLSDLSLYDFTHAKFKNYRR